MKASRSVTTSSSTIPIMMKIIDIIASPKSTFTQRIGAIRDITDILQKHFGTVLPSNISNHARLIGGGSNHFGNEKTESSDALLTNLTSMLVPYVDGSYSCDNDNGSNSFEYQTTAMQCLTAVLQYITSVDKTSIAVRQSIVGKHLGAIAPAIVAILSGELGGGTLINNNYNSESIRTVTMELVKALLQCPRHESSLSMAHELIFRPLTNICNGDATCGFCAGGDKKRSLPDIAVAELFTFAVIQSGQALDIGNCKSHDSDHDEMELFQRQIQKETMALSTIQTLADVFDAILEMLIKKTTTAVTSTVSGQEEQNLLGHKAAIDAISKVYAIAPDAVRNRISNKFSNDNGAIEQTLKSLEVTFRQIDHERQHTTSPSSPKSNSSGIKRPPPAASRNSYPVSPIPTESSAGLKNLHGSSSAIKSQKVSATSIEQHRRADTITSTIAPFLQSVKNPITIDCKSELQSFFQSIHQSLSLTDADSWNVRLDALLQLEQLAAGGTYRIHHPHNTSILVHSLRSMPFMAQIEDLRSQITGQACRVVSALAYELRESFSPLIEMWLPSIIRLACSGVRLMSQQGEKCIVQVTCFAGSNGYPRILSQLCDGCISKSNHQNHKKSCIMGLTVSLRVWTSPSVTAVMEKQIGAIGKAVDAAASHRDPAVREEARNGFWALHNRFPDVANKIMSAMDLTSQKRLQKSKDDVNSSWMEGGAMLSIVSGEEICGHGDAKKGRQLGSAASRPGQSLSGGKGKAESARADEKRTALPKYKSSSRALATSKTKSQVDQPMRETAKEVTKAPHLRSKPWAKTRHPSSAQRIVKRVNSESPLTKQSDGVADASTPKSSACNASMRSNYKPNSLTSQFAISSAPIGSHHVLENKLQTASRAGHALVKGASPTAEVVPITLDSFISMVSSNDWSVRERALSTVVTFLSTRGDKDIDAKSSLPLVKISSFVEDDASREDFVESLATAIDDENRCVAMAALETCHYSWMNKMLSSAMMDYLTLLLPPIMEQQAKYVGSDASEILIIQDCLEAAQFDHGSDALLERISSVLEMTTSKDIMGTAAQLCLLELLRKTISSSVVFVRHSSNLRLLLNRIASFVISAKADDVCFEILSSTGSVLETLFEKAANENLLVKQVLDLKPTEFAVIKDIISEYAEGSWSQKVKERLNVIHDESLSSRLQDEEGDDDIELNDGNLLKETKKVRMTPLLSPLAKNSGTGSTVVLNTKNEAGKCAEVRTPLGPLLQNNMQSFEQLHLPGLPKTPLTDAVMKYMTRPSPLAAVKLSGNPMNDMPRLLEQLSGRHPPQDLYHAMQALLQVAREGNPSSLWDRYFEEVLKCLLAGIVSPQVAQKRFEVLAAFDETPDLANSPITLSREEEVSEARHLYIQGLRVLAKYQFFRFDKVAVSTTVGPLLRCSADGNYFVVHAAERALELIISKQNPDQCLNELLPYLSESLESKGVLEASERSSLLILSTLRVMSKLLCHVPAESLELFLPTIMSCVVKYIKHKSVDLRKVCVFVCVEASLVVSEATFKPYMSKLNESERKLLAFYVNRRELSIAN